MIIYSTSRLARDRLYATLFERELRKSRGPDSLRHRWRRPDTPEGSLMLGMKQICDEFERSKLSRERGMREEALAGIGAERQEAEDEELLRQLDHVPDLTEALRTASPQVKRRVFASFDLQITYDKAEGRVEISATIAEAVAEAIENGKTLLAEGSSTIVTNIAGTGFEPVTSGL